MSDRLSIPPELHKQVFTVVGNAVHDLFNPFQLLLHQHKVIFYTEYIFSM